MGKKKKWHAKRGGTSSHQLQAYRYELLSVVCSAVGLFVALAVLSYQPDDPSFLYAASDAMGVANWAGEYGASLAAWLFYYLGMATYLILISFFVVAFFLIRRGRLWALRCWLSPVLVMLSAAICSYHSWDLFDAIPGGLLGLRFENLLLRPCGPFGSGIVLWASFFTAILILFQIPLIRLLTTVVVRAFVRVIYGVRWAIDAVGRFGIACHMAVHRAVEAIFSAMLPVIKSYELFYEHQEICSDELQAAVEQQVHVSQDPDEDEEDEGYWSQFDEIVDDDELLMSDSGYVLPSLSLFAAQQKDKQEKRQHVAMQRGNVLQEKLEHFGIRGTIVAVKPGPVVTSYEYQPDATSKISKITALEDDLAMALSALSMRIVAPIPGRNAIGFEIANTERETVGFAELVSSAAFAHQSLCLPLALGVDVFGTPIIQDLARMPHLLIGGTTGSGKSVGLQTMLASLLCSRTPEQVRLVLIDPKRLEFSPYADIPHLLTPIITNPTAATRALGWLVSEMERRYELMARMGVRNIADYHARCSGKRFSSEQGVAEQLPYLVLMIDELADLMMVAGKDVETKLVRLAQMSRAAGIHMIVATQRPSVDVVTGLIKVNFPSRIAFRVSSKVDSRTILDSDGAEKLLGKGDMLLMSAVGTQLTRVHGAYLAEQEIEQLVIHLRRQGQPHYVELNATPAVGAEQGGDVDEMYTQVLDFLQKTDDISISLLQRYFRIGFNRSARIIDRLERDGLIAPPSAGSKTRKVVR